MMLPVPVAIVWRKPSGRAWKVRGPSVEGDCVLAEVDRGEEEGAVPWSNYQSRVPRAAVPSWDGGVRVQVPFQVEVPAWEVGEVPARGVRNSEEAGLLGAWGEGREQVTYHVRKLVLREYWNGIDICFQSCVGVEVRLVRSQGRSHWTHIWSRTWWSIVE